MKVLLVNVTWEAGSTDKLCSDLVSELEHKGHIVRVAYGRGPVLDENRNKTIYIGNKFSVYSHVLKSRLFDKCGEGSKKATERFIEDIKKFNPDVIHMHNIHGYYLNLPVLFKFLKDYQGKIVWTLHDCWAFTGHCSHYTLAGCYKWQTECSKCCQLREYPKSILCDNSKNNFYLKKELFTNTGIEFVTVSNWLKNQVKKSFLKDEKVRTIYNGIDLDLFNLDRKNINDDNVILGVAAVWTRSKGLYDFIDLAKILDNKYKLVMVGKMPENIKLPQNIEHINQTNSISELAELYAKASLYFNASVEESFGMTTIESLACGTPVIVYRSTALPEIVSDKAGYIVNPNDIESVKNIIESETYKSITPNDCFEEVLKYDKARQLHQYIELYKVQ